MQQIKKLFDRILAAFCVFLFAMLVILVTWQVFTRLVLNNPSTFTEELAKVFFVWLVLFGAAYVFGERGHMNVVFVADRLPPTAQMWLNVLVEVIIAVFSAMVLIGGGRIAVGNAMAQMSAALPVRMGYIYLAIPLSGALIILYSIINIITLLRRQGTTASGPSDTL